MTHVPGVLEGSGPAEDVVPDALEERLGLLRLLLEVLRAVEVLDVLGESLYNANQYRDETMPEKIERTGQSVQLSRDLSLPGSTVSTGINRQKESKDERKAPIHVPGTYW